MNQNVTKNLLERFSCLLVGGGRKNSGHKILLESLFLLRENNDLTLFSKNSNHFAIEKDNNIKPQNITNQKDCLQYKAKAITQFLCLSRKTGTLLAMLNSKRLVKENEKDVPQSNFLAPRMHNKTLKNSDISNAAANSRKKTKKLDSDFFGIENLLSKYLCLHCVDNVKPILETRKIRKGRVTYKVPLVTSSQRQEGKAIALLIENAKYRKKNEVKNSTMFDLQTASQEKDNLKTFDSFSEAETSNKVTADHAHNFMVPFLYKTQTDIKKSFSELSVFTTQTNRNKNFLILPPHSLLSKENQRSDKTKTHIGLERKPRSLQTDERQKLDVYKKFFLTSENLAKLNPEKTHSPAFSRKTSIKYCLSEELFDSANGKGGSVEKKKQLHNLALQNRAYQNFRWW